MTRRTAIIIGGIGQTLIALGLCVLLFAGFQLWGTGLQTRGAQGSLEDEFAAQMAAVADLAETPTTQPTTTTAPNASSTGESDEPALVPVATFPPQIAPELADALRPENGDASGRIQIERIGVDWIYVEGVTRDALHTGPGHYPTTPFPGQAGNAAIAGHRTTYGSPFSAIDRLEPGDQIVVSTAQGDFNYEVLPFVDEEGVTQGHQIVSPSEFSVVEDQGDNRLTLTACHPKFSARQRIIVSAKLVTAPAPALPPSTDIEQPNGTLASEYDEEAGDAAPPEEANTVASSDNSLEESLGWHYEETRPALLWGALALLVAIIGAIVGARWRKWPAYALTLIPFSPLLFLCFVHLDRLLPAF